MFTVNSKTRVSALKRVFSQTKLPLPSVQPKTGSLRTFLSVEDFRRSTNHINDDLKNLQDSARSKKRRLHITMNEELSSNVNKESSFKTSGSDEQNESTDERKTLLYDKHLINRQKAAANICKMIVDDVANKFARNVHDEESPKVKISKTERYVKELVEKSQEVQDFGGKFEVISERAQDTYLKTFKKTGKSNASDLRVGIMEDRSPEEIATHRISKSKEKSTRDEPVPPQLTDIKDSLSEKQEFYYKNRAKFSQIFSELPKFIPIEKPMSYYSILLQKIELTSPSVPRYLRTRKFIVAFNNECISLPNTRIDGGLILYIVLYLNTWDSLVKVDISFNQIGDKSCALMVFALASFSKKLETIDLSFTQCGIMTANALQTSLQGERCYWNSLRIEGNSLRDEGICSIILGLMGNFSIQYLNISDNQLETLGGLAISKLIRINRTIRGLNCSKSELSGQAFHEISRSLIINPEIRSFSANFCKLCDSDAKEVGHMMNRNSKLQQLCITHNKFTNSGLEWFKYGLQRNRGLIHLALSGNEGIRLHGLEELKKDLQLNLEVDIGKEDDFYKSIEGNTLSLLR